MSALDAAIRRLLAENPDSFGGADPKLIVKALQAQDQADAEPSPPEEIENGLDQFRNSGQKHVSSKPSSRSNSKR